MPAALVALGVAGCEPAAPPPELAGRPSLLLISIDTLRADHLGVYGYERDTSPRLDAFAAEAMVYEDAVAPAPWTLPSHAGLLTGRHPWALGMRVRDASLPGDAPTVAEDLRALGYRTAAFVDSGERGYLGGARGFARGFESYRHAPFGEAGDFRYDAERTVEQAEGWLRERAAQGRPFFLFVHTKSVHAVPQSQPSEDEQHLPYRVPGPETFHFAPSEAGDAWAEPGLGQGVGLLLAWNERRAADPQGRAPIELPARRLERLRDLYDGGIRYTDARVGALLDRLEALGLADRTIVVVTADHGEEFLEHGRFLHSQVYREALRVPLLVRRPGAAPGRSSARVTLMDVAASLRAWAGAPPRGRTLAEARAGAAAEAPRVAFRAFAATDAERASALGQERSYRYEEGPWTLVARVGPQGLESELYHEGDAGEREPRDAPAVEARLRAALERWLSSGAGARGERIEVDAETRRHLRALGYAEE